MNLLKELLSFDDVTLIPQYSTCKERTAIDVAPVIPSVKIPLITAPMDTITEWAMANHVTNIHKGISIIHRYMSIDKQVKAAEHAYYRESKQPQGAAIGATGDFLERAQALVGVGVNLLCVDVAHGHHILVREAIEKLKNTFQDQILIMAGNVATPEAFFALQTWGANLIRVGVGTGAACSTQIQTGHGYPLLQSLYDINTYFCVKESNKLKQRTALVVADGGIRTSGDAVKAFAAGADFVMVGRLLAGTDKTPGDIVRNAQGMQVKTYRGMASREAQLEWRSRSSAPEGISTVVPYIGKTEDVINDFIGGIQSGLSYSGVNSLKELQDNAIFARRTHAGYIEGTPHVTRQTV